MASVIPGRDDLIKFNDQSVTTSQAEKVMNTIYNTLKTVFKEFDLSKKDDIQAANAYLVKNFNSIVEVY